MTARACRAVATGLTLVLLAAGAPVLLTSAPAQADPPDIASYRDLQYRPSVTGPTADKPQSKLWYAYDTWWGLVANRDSGRVHIFRLEEGRGWRDTGTLVDDRVNSTADVLWDGKRLYVASRARNGPLRVTRFSFDQVQESWSRDRPPASIKSGGSASATIAKDSRGRLWVTYTQAARVWVAHTTRGDQTWTAPFTPVVSDASINPDDISSIVGFDGHIGVMWSDQDSDRYTFAVHADDDDDSIWSEEEAGSGFLEVDDHINLQSAPSAQGTEILAAVKTSLDHVPGVPASATQIAVLVRSPSGSWETVPAGRIADGHTRPMLSVDISNQQVYLIAAAAGLGVFYKRSPLDDIAFPAGRGQPLLTSSSGSIDNPTGSKAPVTADSGLVVLANANNVRRYFHAEVDLSQPEGSDSVPPTRPPAVVAEATQGCQVDLIWPPSVDDVEVLGYSVRRNGVDLASTDRESFTDLSTECGATYRYAVAAVDAAGNKSAWSSARSVSTPAVQRGAGIWLAGTSASANSGGRSITVPIPRTERGDVLIASVDLLGAPNVKTPAGWRPVQMTSKGSTLRKATFVRVAPKAAPTSVRWSWDRRSVAVANTLVYRGVSTADPIISAVGRGNKASVLVETPSVAVRADRSAAVGLFGVAGIVALTPPDEMVGHTTQINIGGPRERVTGSTADQLDVDLATGTLAADISHTWPSTGQLIVLRADGASGR
ncbi:hypothetical protein BH24ACT15_BH24ACT15_33030 [soil metagenome]